MLILFITQDFRRHLRNLGTGVTGPSEADKTEEPRKRASKLEVKSVLKPRVFPTYSTGQKLNHLEMG